MERKGNDNQDNVPRRPVRSVDGMLPRRAATHYALRPSHTTVVSDQRVPAPTSNQVSLQQPISPLQPTLNQKGSWQKAVIPMVILLAVLGFVGYRIHTRHHDDAPKTASKTTTKSSSAQKAATTETPPAKKADIAGAMNTAINAQTTLTAAATLIDLTDGQVYNAGSYSQRFEAASTSKLVAIFDYIHQVELGKATLEQNVGGMSAQDNIMRMIIYSDNDAWARMNSYLTMNGEQAYTDSLGLHAQMKYNDIEFTTGDMARMLQLLYQGQLMNDTHKAMVLDYMSRTTVTNLIQAALPAGVTVYHKYGQVDGVLHDASIVEYQGHKFVLVIYTNNPANDYSQYDAQVDLIHKVALAAFNAVTGVTQ